MVDFTTVMTGTAELDVSAVLEYEARFIIAHKQSNVMDALCEYKADIDAKSIDMTKFAALTVNTTALNEREDVVSQAMADTQVLFTPTEHGDVITTTKLSNLQTGGKTDAAAGQLVGQNMAAVQNKLATLALEGTTNVSTVAASEGATVAGDIITTGQLGLIYNKLQRSNQLVHPVTGNYVAVMHPDVIHDLLEATDAGSWQDVKKYSDSREILNNEIGTLKGFTIISNSDCLINVDGGATTVDTYSTSFLAFNGLGKAENMTPGMTVTGPFDKLGRFLNIGWMGSFKYGIVDEDATWKLISSSSVGVNT